MTKQPKPKTSEKATGMGCGNNYVSV